MDIFTNGFVPEETKQEILTVNNCFWDSFANRDIETRFSYCADIITFIGSGLNEKAANKQEYIAINQKGLEQFPSRFRMEVLWQRVCAIDTMAWVESEIEWIQVINGKEEKELLRNTVILKQINNRWLIVHVHGSSPDFRLSGQNYMTNAETIHQNRELEREVYQRTKDLNQTLEDLKNTQALLIQSEKMASLGELTAGIAHEIQNPLNFVNNFSEVNKELLAEMNEEIEKENYAEVRLLAGDITSNEEKINQHGKRADAIVKGMLQHSRSSSGIKEPTDINELADEYLRLAYHGLRAKDKSFNAILKTNYDESLSADESGIGKVNIIPQDIGRVILNLITNAFYVVDEKKKAPQPPSRPRSLSGQDVPKEGVEYVPTVSVSTKKSNDKIVISVRDNGNGIPKNVLDKIFQAFFTTKPTGQGTGLGLSLSYDIVKSHGGELKVETKEGQGSEFTIHLPA